MRYCEKCKVHVRGARERCPLCQAPLTGEKSGGETFPLLAEEDRPSHLFLRLLAFISAASGVICVAVNAMVPTGIWWSLFVVAGIGCFWVSLFIAVKKRGNIPKNILWQLAAMAVLSLLWDVFTGWHAWSVDYVIPILCVLAMVAMAALARILHLKITDYLIYLVIGSLFGIVPVIFLLAGWLHVIYPSVICAASSFLFLAALLTFEGEHMLSELRRRLHLR